MVSDDIEVYVARHTTPLSELNARVQKETYEKTRSPRMLTGPLEGAFLRLLVRLTWAIWTPSKGGHFQAGSEETISESFDPSAGLRTGEAQSQS